MKQNRIFPVVFLLSVLVLSGCDSMLRTKSDRFLLSEEHLLDSPGDTLYSVLGILSKFQQLGDRYVVLGELRADLMDVTQHADQDLRDVSALTIDADSRWADAAPYYDVINHCNFVIARMDTSLFLGGKKVMMPDFAAAKAIRAWTYMQLALNYGKAYYLTDPILTTSDLEAEFPVMDRDAIFALLAEELLPLVDVDTPDYGSINNYDPKTLNPNIRYLLGEIYLWQNDYARAAQMYYDCIYNEGMVVSETYVSKFVKSASTYSLYDEIPQGYTLNASWPLLYTDQSAQSECMTLIPYYYSESFGSFTQYEMYALTLMDFKVCPSERAVNFFENQPYNDFSVTEDEIYDLSWTRDLRGLRGAYEMIRSNAAYISDLAEEMAVYAEAEGTRYINIYSSLDRVVLQRQSLAYLRYAEAVNRMGKPSLAMAVINNGLNRNLFITTPISRSEVTDNDSVMWAYPAFDYNIGTRTRGQGPSTEVTFPPEAQSLADSITYMESILVEECGLETAFNGNRYQDLMRFSHHNATNDIIASNIAEKHLDDYDYYYQLLLDENNWYLPWQE